MRFVTHAMVLAAALGLAAPTLAADGAKFPVKGVVKTFSANVNGCSNVLVPASAIGAGNVFVVKEACWNMSGGVGMFCTAAGGMIINSGNLSSFNCRSLESGAVVPEGADLNCISAACGSGEITITGIIAKEQ